MKISARSFVDIEFEDGQTLNLGPFEGDTEVGESENPKRVRDAVGRVLKANFVQADTLLKRFDSEET